MTRRARTGGETSSGPPAMPVRRLLPTALAFGLWTGLLEQLPIDLARRGGVFVRVSPDLAWMAPAADVVLFGLVALGLLLLGAVRPRARSRPVVLGTFAGWTTLALGLLVERIHPAAVVLLAVGVGTQVGRMTGPRPRRRAVLPAAIATATLLILASAAGPKWRVHTARDRALAALPAPPPGAPNVLLLILDTVRGTSLDFLTAPGPSSRWPPVTVPTLDALARNAVVFEDAVAPAPWTLPSHASMFTGQWPTRLTANWGRPLSPRHPTVAQVMTGHGYVTVGVVGNVLYASRETGLARGFLYFDDYPVSPGQALLSSSVGRRLAASARLRRLVGWEDLPNRRTAEEVTDHFLAWQGRHGDRPFFAWVNYFDAHEPYFPPDSVRGRLPDGITWNDYVYFAGLLSGVHARRDDKDAMSLLQATVHAGAYHAAVRRVDREVGRLLTELARRGVLENTVLIIAADHGEQLGEHRLFEHQNSLYRTTLHVPLLIRAPDAPNGGVRIGATVSLRDVGATILDLAGFDAGDSGLGGRSLSRFWRHPEGGGPGSPPAPDTVFSVLNPRYEGQEWLPVATSPVMFSLSDPTYHYIVNVDRSEELYAVKRDPGEVRNLAGAAESRSVVAAFRAMLVGVLGGAPGAPGAPDEGR